MVGLKNEPLERGARYDNQRAVRGVAWRGAACRRLYTAQAAQRGLAQDELRAGLSQPRPQGPQGSGPVRSDLAGLGQGSAPTPRPGHGHAPGLVPVMRLTGLRGGAQITSHVLPCPTPNARPAYASRHTRVAYLPGAPWTRTVPRRGRPPPILMYSNEQRVVDAQTHAHTHTRPACNVFIRPPLGSARRGTVGETTRARTGPRWPGGP